MADLTHRLKQLRTVITENLRVQRGGAESVPYIDVSNALPDVKARQNHVAFGRRGCGKSLLLHYSAKELSAEIRTVYLNCEDFKQHTFPNVLIEILDALFIELEIHLTGWFGKKKRSRQLIKEIRQDLERLRHQDDAREERIKETSSASREASIDAQVSTNIAVKAGTKSTSKSNERVEKEYFREQSKTQALHTFLPAIKKKLREFFEISGAVKSVFVQLDDFYHLKRTDQPFVMDYIHRLCKDLPLYFKVATLRHASVLYAVTEGQPTGAQERHDYQPINIDFSFRDFKQTCSQIHAIFCQYCKMAGISREEFEGIFKGDGFGRLVLSGGGVPRDCLSLFLEALTQAERGDGRIGKDDIRSLSLSTFQRRIEELKQDSEKDEQYTLLSGIYVLRRFCLDRGTNVFLVPERSLTEKENLRELVFRLLDYRVIHSIGSAFTHKTHQGSFHAFMIDIGCYAHLRKLHGKFVEVDLSSADAKENIRSGQILPDSFMTDLRSAPENAESALYAES